MVISLVVPVFNEEQAIPLFFNALRRDLDGVNHTFELIFVDDGSGDNTVAAIRSQAFSGRVRIVEFSRNFGKEPALLAGLRAATGDAVIPIDVDLQDPIHVIPALVARWQDGVDTVLAQRIDRRCDTWLKRQTARWFYRAHNKISSPGIVENVGDFRLLSRETVNAILQLPERTLFMKGLLSWAGGKTAVVTYTREPRQAGASKFNGWTLWKLAVEGITSFSIFPLQLWTYLGFFIASLSLTYALWMIIDKLIWGNDVPGYPSLMVAILFIGGVQLISIGVLGEYIGRIFIEVKGRPRYILKQDSEGSDDVKK
ncbi:glycosyltransferase family 2 protein [Enterobacter quasihormaechei]|uniref:glycosyltransferase family 2 protein n=1 Tax=Enterobacter quasihormaechei TaxID=2529382 RepID=UPI002FD3E2BE